MLLCCHQRFGMGITTRPNGATHPVHIILRLIGQVEVHHVGQLVDVEALRFRWLSRAGLQGPSQGWGTASMVGAA